ncbi:hypothetical protein HV824_22730 [Myxococcus sp. AM009]|uniref:hypothetical protein n=1 Tax=unclassified Myxococcus TaxID=2648731 RepID=UPI0015960A9B|nr:MULTISPECIES: hypothetical protein [unclassified Myxococcus]NVJ00912.1 hypothetical protein [Myxococcus sp. AM009]NVJ14152.1 hypothetical protein [Myxococcus sp. AM010]
MDVSAARERGGIPARAFWPGVFGVTAAFSLFCLGVEYTPDSLHYLSVARGLVSGSGLSGTLLAVDTAMPRPLDLWPPLFPMAWAALLWLGPDAAVITLHLLCFAALAAALFSMAPEGQGARYLWTCAVLIVLYRPFGHVAAAAWSEPLCVALLALALAREVRGADSAGRSFLVGALLGLAVLTRYAALFVLPGLLWWRFVRAREAGGARRHAVHALALGAGLGLVVAPWFVRNVALFGRALGPPRAPRGVGLVSSLLSGVDTLLGEASFGAFGVLCVAATVWLLMRAPRGVLREHLPDAALERLRPAALMAVSYVAGLFWTATRTQMDTLDGRLLAPLGVGLVPVTAAVLVSLVERSRLMSPPVLVTTGVVVVAGHLWAPLHARVRQPRQGFNHLRERIAPLPAWVEAHVTERDLLLGPQLWWVHPFARAPVVADGYPERGFLTRQTLGPYLRQHGAAYERFFWFDTRPPPVDAAAFEAVEVARLEMNAYWSTVWNTVWEIRPVDRASPVDGREAAPAP